MAATKKTCKDCDKYPEPPTPVGVFANKCGEHGWGVNPEDYPCYGFTPKTEAAK